MLRAPIQPELGWGLQHRGAGGTGMLQDTHLEESGRVWGLQTHGGRHPGVGGSGMSEASGKNPPGTLREHPERG